MRSNIIAHHGIKGMKWGVRRFQNKDGSLTLKGRRRYGEDNVRTLKKGTEIQNISRRQLSSDSKKSGRIYGSYTDADKAEYLDMMGNFEYNERGYKNTFTVKKDIKIASEREVVRTIAEMFRDNPKSVSDMMAKAYNAVNVPILFSKKGKGYERKLSDLSKNPDSKKSMELGREFLKTVPMSTKTTSIADDFYGRMVKKGFDAVLDTNDAYNVGATQDPLIIFNMEKLGNVKSVKLTKDELEAASKYTGSKEFKKSKKDTSSMAHSQIKRKGDDMSYGELRHHGIKGMKWGVRRFQTDDGSLTPAGLKRYSDSDSSSKKSSNSSKTSTSGTKKKATASASVKKSTKKSPTMSAKKTTTQSASKKTTASKTKKKTATETKKSMSPASKTVATALRMRQTQQTYNAINSMLTGDFGGGLYSMMSANRYSRVNNWLFGDD